MTACHRVQAGAVVPQYCPAIGCLTVQCVKMPSGVLSKPPPSRILPSVARTMSRITFSAVFLNSPGLLPRANPSMACMACCISCARATSHHQPGRCLSRFCCPDGGRPRNSRPTAGPQIPAGSVSFQDRPGTVHRPSHSHQDRSVHAARPVPSGRLPAPSVPQNVFHSASRECFSLYLPVKKIFKLPMPGLSLQQA